ncbi:interferon lambda-3-like [Strix aluco]|uniref:interferon lambda-3-like n=1 Tax=Strix aluco TaxID=111821 RepID=UPI003DA4F15E
MLHLVLTLLLALVLQTSLGAVIPHNTLKKSCYLSKYRFPVFHETNAVLRMREKFVSTTGNGGLWAGQGHGRGDAEFETLSDKKATKPLADRKCTGNIFHRNWDMAKLSVPDRVMLVKAELNLTITVLELPAAPSFAKTRQQPLAFLTQVQNDLQCWMDTEAPSHEPSEKLSRWLNNLQTARETKTNSCLEASAIRHIFEVLNDLRCVAFEEQCN